MKLVKAENKNADSELDTLIRDAGLEEINPLIPVLVFSTRLNTPNDNDLKKFGVTFGNFLCDDGLERSFVSPTDKAVTHLKINIITLTYFYVFICKKENTSGHLKCVNNLFFQVSKAIKQTPDTFKDYFVSGIDEKTFVENEITIDFVVESVFKQATLLDKGETRRQIANGSLEELCRTNKSNPLKREA